MEELTSEISEEDLKNVNSGILIDIRANPNQYNFFVLQDK